MKKWWSDIEIILFCWLPVGAGIVVMAFTAFMVFTGGLGAW